MFFGMILAILCYKGDLTEDPDHPKLFWPSDQNCPRCYNWKSKRSISVDVGLAVLIEGMLYLVDKYYRLIFVYIHEKTIMIISIAICTMHL